MGFFEKFKETASAVGDKVKETSINIGDKSKTAIEKQKLKNSISKENNNIKNQYAEIGKKYFEIYGDTNTIEELTSFIEEIKKSKANIESLNSQLLQLDDFVVCSCGARVPKGVAFCSNCGSAIEVPEPEKPVEPVEEVIDAEPVIETEPTVETEDTSTNDTTSAE